MNLSHLYYFKKLVEVRNYPTAARELYITQSTLSLAVTNLEKELGTPLIKRKRNLVELTEEGELLYSAVKVATNTLDNATGIIRERVSDASGKIRLGSVFSIQDSSWSHAMREYREQRKHPADIIWTQGTTPGLMADLKEGSIDVAMAGMLPNPDPDIASFPTSTQQACLLVNKGNPFAHTEGEIDLDDLGSTPILTYRDKVGPFVKEITALLKSCARNPNAICAYTDEITLASLVVANPDVVAIACRSWLLDSFADVVTLPIKNAPKEFHQFYVSYRKNDYRSKALEEFLAFMREYDFGDVSDAITSNGPQPVSWEEFGGLLNC